ncbi:MAG: type II secretion system F family protein [Candidatus Vogelbacteria bacterium]|nr:type II secretion system F family protein [Candidatus Vogelbacteria bacterium]
MKFHYQARDKEGKEIEGEREANDRFALAREMRAEGLTLVSAKPESVSSNFSNRTRLKRWLAFGRVKIKDKIVFASNLSAMVAAGLSLARALAVMERQAGSKRFRQVISELAAKIRAGAGLNQALAAFPDVFPPVFVAMVASGEESGKLPQSLEIVAEQMMKSYDLRRKVRGAMIYPVIIVIVIILIGILMMIFLVPNLTAVFKELGAELPLSTRLVIATSNFLSEHTLIFFFLLLALSGAVVVYFRSRRGRRTSAWLVLHLPLIAPLAREVNSAATMRTLSSLISSGVGMVEALAITRRVVQNHYYQTVIETAGAKVEKGQTLSSVFKDNEHLYPVLVGEMTEVGEETGKLADMLLRGAVFYEEEVNQATKNLSTVIEPVLMIIIGLAVGFFAVSMIGPIYSLSENL